MYFPGEREDDDDEEDEEEDDSTDSTEESDEVVNKPINSWVGKGGDAFSFGYGYFGQLGQGDTQTYYLPKQMISIKDVVQVACGEGHSIAITASGKIYGWGSNKYGQLGLGDTKDRSSPVLLESMTGIYATEAACGTHHTAILTRDGEVYTFGCGFHARLGHGDNKHLSFPRIVTTLRGKRIIQIACGGMFSACVSNAGALYTWGCNRYGQLGHGKTPAVQMLPRHVTTLYGRPVSKVTCGKHHTVALTDDGECYSFGAGMCGQLGHRNKQHQLLPKQIESLSKKKTIDIACGNLHTLALAEDNVLYIWGYVSDDHLGLSEGEEYHSAPILVDTSHITNQIVRVAAGSWHSALLTNRGELYTWGFGYRNRLGLEHAVPMDPDNEQFSNPIVPAKVERLSRHFVFNVGCGGAHTIAIVLDLEMANNSDQLNRQVIQ